MFRLNFGCGPTPPEGWVNVDRDDYGQEHVLDIRDGLPLDNGRVAFCVSIHALQMLPWPDLVPALVELRRVTRPDGALRILVPDLLAAFDAYRHRHFHHFRVSPDIEPSVDGAFCVYITQAGATRSVFTAPHLADLLVRAGWRTPRLVGHRETTTAFEGITELDNREDESIRMEADA